MRLWLLAVTNSGENKELRKKDATMSAMYQLVPQAPA
jgi:hypothetical protein